MSMWLAERMLSLLRGRKASQVNGGTRLRPLSATSAGVTSWQWVGRSAGDAAERTATVYISVGTSIRTARWMKHLRLGHVLFRIIVPWCEVTERIKSDTRTGLSRRRQRQRRWITMFQGDLSPFQLVLLLWYVFIRVVCFLLVYFYLR